MNMVKLETCPAKKNILGPKTIKPNHKDTFNNTDTKEGHHIESRVIRQPRFQYLDHICCKNLGVGD